VTHSTERGDLEMAVTTAMLRVFDKVQRNRRLARDYGTGDLLTMVEAEVCQVIAVTVGISPSDLADHIGVSRSAVSQALNRMRSRGLVTVEHPPDNAKARVARVTDVGATVAAGVNELHRQMAEAVYAGTTSDLEAYLELFNRLDTFFADVIASSTATNPASNRS
jgi:DNA-binding MarR family transcriptional regulator